MISGKATNMWPPDRNNKTRCPIHYTGVFCWTSMILLYDFIWVLNDPRVKDVSYLSVDVHLDPTIHPFFGSRNAEDLGGLYMVAGVKIIYRRNGLWG